MQLKTPWLQWAAELRDICLQGVANKTVDGRKMQARYFEPWFEKLSAWAADETLEQLDIGTGFSRLTAAGLAEAWKGEPPSHPALDAMAGLKASLDALPTPDAAVLEHAARWVGARFEEEKRRRAEMGFDDMLLRLDAALQADGGERLASLIREQFPVALIDGVPGHRSGAVPDLRKHLPHRGQQPRVRPVPDRRPEAAIYAFRGADIYTYLRARQATEGRLHTLGTNFRSSQAMVTAVNHVFERAEQREQGRGAFLFRQGAENPVPFLPVAAPGAQGSPCRSTASPWRRSTSGNWQPSSRCPARCIASSWPQPAPLVLSSYSMAASSSVPVSFATVRSGRAALRYRDPGA